MDFSFFHALDRDSLRHTHHATYIYRYLQCSAHEVIWIWIFPLSTRSTETAHRQFRTTNNMKNIKNIKTQKNISLIKIIWTGDSLTDRRLKRRWWKWFRDKGFLNLDDLHQTYDGYNASVASWLEASSITKNIFLFICSSF